MAAEPSPKAIADTLAAFVNTLLPGDDLFPSASSTGTQAGLADRMRAARPPVAFADFCESLTLQGRSFSDLTYEERVSAVANLESDNPQFFSFLRMATVLAYYATPTVIEAIRALGHDYNDAPQPEGYDLPKFAFVPGVDIPMNPKGFFKWTFMMEPIDISSLADLDLPRQSVAHD
jgi:Gluconate 2-dehydrogenase subunit 3